MPFASKSITALHYSILPYVPITPAPRIEFIKLKLAADNEFSSGVLSPFSLSGGGGFSVVPFSF